MIPVRALQSSLLAMAASLVSACGANHSDVPPELLDAIKHPILPDAGAGYPAGPYSTHVGDVVENLCFQGWRDPKAAGFDPKAFTRICFGDFHSDAAARLLLVESCAVWCAACKTEYAGSGNRPSLADHLAQREKDGFRVMGTIFQDAGAGDAQPKDAASWARTFDIGFPFALDAPGTTGAPSHQLGLFAPSTVAPYNMLIDTHTMKIVLELQGDVPATLFQKVDEFLATAP